LQEIKDELQSARRREAVWISIIVHLVFALLLYTAPRWMPHSRLASMEDQLIDQKLTYMATPEDLKSLKKQQMKSMADKATHNRAPQIDSKTLDQLRKADAVRAAAQPAPTPGQMSMPSPVPAPMPTPAAAPQQQTPVENPQLAMQQPKSNPFATSSAGNSLNRAAHNMPRGGGFGGVGSVAGGGQAGSGVQILSDTQGVDFDPYIKRVLHDIRQNWYHIMPEEAMPPLLKNGKVVIDFVIMPNGKVMGMQLRGPSGDTPLDRAAWGGITASNPFPNLPNEFHGPYLALRISFYYNPKPGQMNE